MNIIHPIKQILVEILAHLFSGELQVIVVSLVIGFTTENVILANAEFVDGKQDRVMGL